ncbi:synaptogyrin-3a isoform X1 [Poeciliopsis prolifica]|uniref:synaptogyrin-3a isoform X1 n=1 Tax=Poeciliopsis prolifica TaxID=188132 RepID=UPI0024136B35|nr:synaptogyrin-3a isoform X1 [Poeciliopsis prolifica]
MDGVGSFGAGRTGTAVDPIAFAKQPQTILRALSWIFSLVVFASIVNEGYVNLGSERLHCVFNRNGDACNYGVFVGLVGLLACSFFFLLDYKFSSISSVKDRKKAVMLEIGFSGFWTFLYFVSFCFLANQWSRTKIDDLPLNQGADAARAAIAFSFFSIITWVRLRLGNHARTGRKRQKNAFEIDQMGSINRVWSSADCFLTDITSSSPCTSKARKIGSVGQQMLLLSTDSIRGADRQDLKSWKGGSLVWLFVDDVVLLDNTYDRTVTLIMS